MLEIVTNWLDLKTMSSLAGLNSYYDSWLQRKLLSKLEKAAKFKLYFSRSAAQCVEIFTKNKHDKRRWAEIDLY